MNTDTGYNNIEYLVHRFTADLVRLSYVYVHNREDAEDTVQQVFLTYLARKPVFNDENHAKNWLCKTTVNTSRNLLRSRRNNVNFDDLEGVLCAEDTERYERTDEEDKVFRAVMKLKTTHRELIHMYYYSGYSMVEISEILGIPQSTVRSRMMRARVALETILKKGDNADVSGIQKRND